MTLADVFDRDWIRLMAPGRVIARGGLHVSSGDVVVSTISDDHVVANVHGSTTHRVELEAGSSPDWECTCSEAANGSFCRHCVAVALTVVPAEIDPDSLRDSDDEWDDAADSSADGDRRDGPNDRSDAIRTSIESLSLDTLRDIVAEQAKRDPRLKHRLLSDSDVTG